MWQFIKIFAKNGPKLIKWFMAKPFSDQVMLVKDFVIPKIKLSKLNKKISGEKKDYDTSTQALALLISNRRANERQHISNAIEGSFSNKVTVAKKAVEREIDKIDREDNKVSNVIPKNKLFSTGKYSKSVQTPAPSVKIDSDIKTSSDTANTITGKIKQSIPPNDITSRKHAPKELKQAFEAIETKINKQSDSLSNQNIVVGTELAKTIQDTAKEVNKAKNVSLNRLEENIDKRYKKTTEQIKDTHQLINDQNKILSTQIVETTNIQAKNIKSTGNKINKTQANSLHALSSQLYKNEMARVESHKESIKMMMNSRNSMEDMLLKMDDSKNIKAILGNTYNIMKAQYANLQDTKRNADQLIHDIANDVARQVGETVGFFGGALAQGLGLLGDALKDVPFIGPIGKSFSNISKGMLGLLGLEPTQINGLLSIFTKLRTHEQANKEARTQYGLSTKSAVKLMEKNKNGKTNLEMEKDKINRVTELIKNMKNEINMAKSDKNTSKIEKQAGILKIKQDYNEKIKKISLEIAKEIGITENEDIFSEGLVSEIEDTENMGKKKISTEQLEKNLQLTSQALQYREGNNAEVLKNINAIVQGNDEGEKKFLYKKYAQILAEKDSSYWDKNGDIDYDRMVNDDDFKRKLFGASGLLLRPKTAERHAEETINNRIAPYNADTIKMLEEYKDKERELQNTYYNNTTQTGTRDQSWAFKDYQKKLNTLQKTYAPFLKSKDKRQEEQEKAQIIPMLQKTSLPELFNKKNKLEMNKNYSVNQSDLLNTNIEIYKQKKEHKDVIDLIKKYYPDADAFIQQNIANNKLKTTNIIPQEINNRIQRNIQGDILLNNNNNIENSFMNGIKSITGNMLNIPPQVVAATATALHTNSDMSNNIIKNLEEPKYTVPQTINNKQDKIIETMSKISQDNVDRSNVILQDIIATQLETLKDVKELKHGYKSPIVLQMNNAGKASMFDIKNENSL